MQDLVNTSYPSLVAHANRMYARTLSASLRTRDAAPDHESDVWETRLRFAFIGLTLGGIFTYLTAAINST